MASDEDPFGLILRAAQMLHQGEDSSPPQGLGIAESDVDSEEEMEEGESGVTQRSPSGTSSPGSSRQAAGSKEEKDSNQLEKPSSWRLGSGEEEELEGSPGVSTEAGGRPESNDKHNMKERLRRKDQKQAIVRLRNQLQRRTKKPSTISVLKAAMEEIKGLKSMAAKQGRELDAEKERHSFLKWRLEKLKSEYDDPGQRAIRHTQRPLLLPQPLAPIPSPAAPLTFLPPQNLPPHGHPNHISPLLMASPPTHHSNIGEQIRSPVLPARFGFPLAPLLTPSVALPFSPPHIHGYPPSPHYFPLPSPHHHHHHPVSPQSTYLLPYTMFPHHPHASLGSFPHGRTHFPPNYPPLQLMTPVRSLAIPYSVPREIPPSSSVNRERWSSSSCSSTNTSMNAPFAGMSSAHPDGSSVRETTRVTSVITSSASRSSTAETEHVLANRSSTRKELEEDEEIEVEVVRSPAETESNSCSSPESPGGRLVGEVSPNPGPGVSSNNRAHSRIQNRTPVSELGHRSGVPRSSTESPLQGAIRQVQHQFPKNLLPPPVLSRTGAPSNEAAVLSKLIGRVQPQREVAGEAAVRYALKRFRRLSKCLGKRKKVQPLPHHLRTIPVVGWS